MTCYFLLNQGGYLRKQDNTGFLLLNNCVDKKVGGFTESNKVRRILRRNLDTQEIIKKPLIPTKTKKLSVDVTEVLKGIEVEELLASHARLQKLQEAQRRQIMDDEEALFMILQALPFPY